MLTLPALGVLASETQVFSSVQCEMVAVLLEAGGLPCLQGPYVYTLAVQTLVIDVRWS